MKHVRKRLTYANVMSSIAVFLLLGGGAAFAAGKLAKNSVGSKQIKKNAVTTAKIKNNAVTTSKIKNGAVSGAKINLSSLGTVPNATHASSADTANSASSASNAEATNGMHLGRINFVADANTPETTVFSGGGLTLHASCDGGEELNLTATTSVAHAEIMESGNFNSTYKGAFDNNFEPTDTENVGANIGDGTQEEVQGQLVYSTPSGGVVTAQFSLEDNGVFNGRDCAAIGTVQFS